MQSNEIERELRRLRVAVYVLAALVFMSFMLSMFRIAPRTPSTVAAPPTALEANPADAWDTLSLQQKIAQSSAVLLTRNVVDGQRQKALVAEILKQDPSSQLYYSVGDEMARMSSHLEGSQDKDEGSVAFLQGSPASFRASYGIQDGRISGLGDMPLESFKLAVKRSK